MGVTLNVEFKKPVPRFGTLTDDLPALGNGLERLDKVLEKVGLDTLGRFASTNPDDVEDEDDEYAAMLPPVQWFKPAAGLKAVRGALDHLQKHPRAMSWSADAVEELERVEKALTAAAKRKVDFHFLFCD